MTNRNLRSLLAPWISNIPELLIKEITLDSRTASIGDLFIAVVGHQKDGRHYISHAISRGVAAVVAQTEDINEDGKVFEKNGVPIIYLNDLLTRLSTIAKRFYNQKSSSQASSSMHIVGITGTNGKTTTAHIMAQWVQLLGETSAVMGSIGNGILHNIHPSNNTTGSPIEIQQMLAQLRQQGANFVAMEVSSHALVQNRVSDVYFSAAVFTNLSHDHLDYHGNISQYEASKWRLFSELNVGQSIINVDDATGNRWINILPQAIAVAISEIPSGKHYNNWLLAEKIHYHANGANIYFRSSWGAGILKSPLIGKFNANNILLALATLLYLGYPLSLLIARSSLLTPVCGRMERFHTTGYPTVIVDYAHNPDALKQVLLSIRTHCHGKLWCIFGCGGDRDKSKRPLMGAIAERYADYVVITNDNPRSEAPQDIFDDIKNGFLNLNKIKIIYSRTEAVKKVIMQASSKDLVLIAGKGHENYQIIGQKRLQYSDRITVANLLEINK